MVSEGQIGQRVDVDVDMVDEDERPGLGAAAAAPDGESSGWMCGAGEVQKWLEDQMVDVGELSTVEELQAAKGNWRGAVPLALVEKLFTLNEKQGVAFQIAARRMLLGAGLSFWGGNNVEGNFEAREGWRSA